MREFNPELTIRQTQALDALECTVVKEDLYGGAKGGGKSHFGCVWSYLECMRIIKEYSLKPSNEPITVGFMGRKVGRDFTDTTLESWKQTIPPELYQIKGKPAEIIIENTVKIKTGGFDRTELINKFNSAQFAFFFIDQAEELDDSDILLLRAATFGRLILNGQQVPGKGLLTANPAQNWLKMEFITNPPKDGSKVFTQALPGDNPYLGQVYIDNLHDIFRNRPELLEAYLFGNWDAVEGADQIIKSHWLRAAASRTIYFPSMRKILCCDPARFGDDETVIYYLENTEIEDDVIMPECKTTDISNRLASMSMLHDDCDIVVESTGADLGAGVIDELEELGRNVIQFNPAGKANEPEKYYNRRAEIWCRVADMLGDGEVELKNTEPQLITQLCAPKYNFKRGRILIEEKEEIKKRLGRSPDRAEALVIGLSHLDYVEPQEEEKISYKRKVKVPQTAMI